MTDAGHRPRRVLFLCTHNSARSQMAEGLLRHVAGSQFEVVSAGTEPSGVRPEAVAVMDEIGVDISSHQSEHLDAYRDTVFDYVITVCDDAAEECPVFPGETTRLHWSLPDPSAVEAERRLEAFRDVRDGLRDRIKAWLGSLEPDRPGGTS